MGEAGINMNLRIYHSAIPANFKALEPCAFVGPREITFLMTSHEEVKSLKKIVTGYPFCGQLKEGDDLWFTLRLNEKQPSNEVLKFIQNTEESAFLHSRNSVLFEDGISGIDLILGTARFEFWKNSPENLKSIYSFNSVYKDSVSNLMNRFVLNNGTLICRTILQKSGCIADMAMYSWRKANTFVQSNYYNDELKPYYDWLNQAAKHGFRADKLNHEDIFYHVDVFDLNDFRRIKANQNNLDYQTKDGRIA